MVPIPVLDEPAATVTRYCGGGGAKLASTLAFWLTVSVHVALVPAAAHAPPHPAKVLPAVADAVRVSCVPCGNVSLQSLLCEVAVIEQLIPVPLTVPVPPLLGPAPTVTV
jgi:hypothetical protein